MFRTLLKIGGEFNQDIVLNVVTGAVLLAEVTTELLMGIPPFLTYTLALSLAAFNFARAYYWIKKAHTKEKPKEEDGI